ncbi:MAG: hypothetical protein FWF98_03460 [Dehalococcoidia bacterium]|nr:hypothetical protein [Dehalococcoidia bacterium]
MSKVLLTNLGTGSGYYVMMYHNNVAEAISDTRFKLSDAITEATKKAKELEADNALVWANFKAECDITAKLEKPAFDEEKTMDRIIDNPDLWLIAAIMQAKKNQKISGESS